MKRKFILIAMLMLASLCSKAQELVVQSFTLSQTDIIPANELRKDLNGRNCALVKIQMVDEITRVEGNIIGDIVDRGVEKWVYITNGTKEIRIFPKHYLPVRVSFEDYSIERVESRQVFILKISENLSNIKNTEENKGNYLVMEVHPTNATVYIANKFHTPDESGYLSVYLPYGIYDYQIDANGGYESKIGEFEIGKEKTIIAIELEKKREFGTANIEYFPINSIVFIDGKEMGTTPLVVDNIELGNHQLIITKKGYDSHQETITLNDKTPIFIKGRLQTVSITSQQSDNTTEYKNKDDSTSNKESIDQQSVDNKSFTFNVGSVTFKMIKVEGGLFSMGATDEQLGDHMEWELPVHTVKLDTYYIGETEVTQELWEAVMGDNPSHHKGAKLPVENVSWIDCNRFIKKLQIITDSQFRMLTEAEWEFAARGGNQSKNYKYSGSNTLDDVAWYVDNSSLESHIIGQKLPNELGIYDMSGNVSEWCNDLFESYTNKSQKNPLGSDGSLRVLRGGSMSNGNSVCRIASRMRVPSDINSHEVGLRLAISHHKL